MGNSTQTLYFLHAYFKMTLFTTKVHAMLLSSISFDRNKEKLLGSG